MVEDQVEPELPVGDEMGVDEVVRTRTSARLRELYHEEFVSESDVEVDEDIEYESDGVEIIEQYVGVCSCHNK